MKKRLQHYREINLELQQIQDKIASLRNTMYTLRSSSDISGVPGGSGNSDKIGAIVAQVADLESVYYKKLGELFLEQREVEGMIEKLEPVERLLMRSKYIDGNTWEDVCVIIGYSWRQTHRLHGVALQKLQRWHSLAHCNVI